MTEKTLVEIFEDTINEYYTLDQHGNLDRSMAAINELALKAVIEAYEARKWQPIETAPLIQDVLTATNGKDVCVAKKSFYTYNPDNLFFVSAAGLKIFPTHWQPLPVPQKQ